MKNDKNKIDQSRRNLIKGIGTVAVAGAVGAGVTQSVEAKEAVKVPESTDKLGYHETQHIRDYYDTL